MSTSWLTRRSARQYRYVSVCTGSPSIRIARNSSPGMNSASDTTPSPMPRATAWLGARCRRVVEAVTLIWPEAASGEGQLSADSVEKYALPYPNHALTCAWSRCGVHHAQSHVDIRQRLACRAAQHPSRNHLEAAHRAIERRLRLRLGGPPTRNTNCPGLGSVLLLIQRSGPFDITF